MSAELLKALADLAWPILAAVVLFALLPTIIRIARSGSFSIKYGDMEISVQNASNQIRKQIEDLQDQVRALQETQPVVGREAESIPQPTADMRKGTILWVDDTPQNNAHEIAKLQDDDWDISLVESTAAALTWLRSRSSPPTLVISDMGRREGITYRKTAGLDLISEMHAQGRRVPVIVYASDSAVREYRERVERAGGSGITASPIGLFRMVERHAAQQGTQADAQQTRAG